MDAKTKKAVRVIIDRYKTWLSYDNARLKNVVREDFGKIKKCPLCSIYNGSHAFGCSGCPAIRERNVCCDQYWYIELSFMRQSKFRFSFITVRKALKERIEYYEEKLRM